jgi:hypothetical protein
VIVETFPAFDVLQQPTGDLLPLFGKSDNTGLATLCLNFYDLKDETEYRLVRMPGTDEAYMLPIAACITSHKQAHKTLLNIEPGTTLTIGDNVYRVAKVRNRIALELNGHQYIY